MKQFPLFASKAEQVKGRKRFSAVLQRDSLPLGRLLFLLLHSSKSLMAMLNSCIAFFDVFQLVNKSHLDEGLSLSFVGSLCLVY